VVTSSTSNILVGALASAAITLCVMAADRRRAAAQALRKIGARIRQLRTERAMSQETLAFDSGVALNSIATIERGEANPSVAVLLAIARTLKVRLRDLVDDL